MDLSFAVSPVTLALSVAAAAALAWWAYGRSTPAVRGWRRGALAALRFAALFLVLLLLVDAVWKQVTRSGEPPLLAVLVDDSESLRLGAGPPGAAIRAALDDLPEDTALRFYRFAGDAEPAGGRLRGDSLGFRGERTDLSAALARVEADFAGRNLRGVLLLSDGRSTDGRNPAFLAERFPVPLYTATAGDSLSTRDVQLARAVTNDVARLGSPLPIQAAVRAIGYDGAAVPLTVSASGQAVARGSVAAPGGAAEATADLTVTPTRTGLVTYTVTAGPLPGEATTRNNSRTLTVRVVDDRRRILLVAAGPSPDLAALRAVLDADRSVEVTTRTQRAPGQFYEGPLPDGLGRFDLLLLAGYPGAAADPGTAARLAAAVADGLPAVFVQTAQTDFGRLRDAFGEVLPASPEVARAGAVEVSLAPTAAGEAHPLLEGLPLGRLAALPPLAASPSRWALRPGTRVLATVRRGGTVLEVPLLAVRQSGAVRTAALLGAGSWRWRTLPDDLGDLRGVYAQLVDRLVRWTTATRDRRPVRVRADRDRFGERDRVTFTGQVYGESLTPIDDARVTLAVRTPGGETLRAAMRPLGNGRYVADLGLRPPGRYAFSAEAEAGGAPLGRDGGGFSVGPIAAEYRDPGADPALMRQLAVRSGGAVVGLDTLGAFVRGLRASGALADRPLVREDETPLLDVWPLLLAIVLLLAAEWVWRKRLGMV